MKSCCLAGAVEASKTVVLEKTGRIKDLAPVQFFQLLQQKALHWCALSQFSIPVAPRVSVPVFFAHTHHDNI